MFNPPTNLGHKMIKNPHCNPVFVTIVWWSGIVLDEPQILGTCNGCYGSRLLFPCHPNHGKVSRDVVIVINFVNLPYFCLLIFHYIYISYDIWLFSLSLYLSWWKRKSSSAWLHVSIFIQYLCEFFHPAFLGVFSSSLFGSIFIYGHRCLNS